MLKPQPSLHSCLSGSSSWKIIRIPSLQIADLREAYVLGLRTPKPFAIQSIFNLKHMGFIHTLSRSCTADILSEWCCSGCSQFLAVLCLGFSVNLELMQLLNGGSMDMSENGCSGMILLELRCCLPLRIQSVLHPKKEMLSQFPSTGDLPECGAHSFFSAVLYLHQLWTNSLIYYLAQLLFRVWI